MLFVNTTCLQFFTFLESFSEEHNIRKDNWKADIRDMPNKTNRMSIRSNGEINDLRRFEKNLSESEELQGVIRVVQEASELDVVNHVLTEEQIKC